MVNENVTIALVYGTENPVLLAHSEDPELILAFAEEVIGDAACRAETASERNELLGELEHAEAARLRAVLTALIPDLRNRSAHAGAVM